MKKCKWAGDPEDEYCKSCDGVKMEVDGKSIPCSECAGYEPGTEDTVSEKTEDTEAMNPPFDETAEKAINKPENTPNKSDATNTTPNVDMTPTEADKRVVEKAAKKLNKKTAKTVVVKEEKEAEETTDESGIKVVALKYFSGVTIQRGENSYFKFGAEETWDVSQIPSNEVQDARDKLWAKLNGEVDKQIEELNNM